MGTLSCTGTGNCALPPGPQGRKAGLCAGCVLQGPSVGAALGEGCFCFFTNVSLGLFSILDGAMSPGPKRPEPKTGWRQTASPAQEGTPGRRRCPTRHGRSARSRVDSHTRILTQQPPLCGLSSFTSISKCLPKFFSAAGTHASF